MKGKQSTNRVYGILGLLVIALAVLKLAGAITWGWAWILAPLWLPLAVLVAVVFVLEAIKAYKNQERGNRR